MFYKGGETIRGFRRSGIGPRDLGSVNSDALGGKNFYAGTAELRFPIPFIPDELGMGAAVFADAGSLWEASSYAKSNLPGLVGDEHKLRASAGMSILWNSPLGPLRADYAFPLMREKYDVIERFRFGASTKF